MNKYKDIIESIREEDVTLFVGSGCSLASGAPSAAKLTEAIWNLLEKDFQEGIVKTSLQSVSESLVVQENNDRTKLNRILTDSFSGLEPSSFHRMLMKIPHIHTIITTNYDSLIETAYSLDYFQTIADNSELVCADSKKVQLLKIHGDLKHLNDIIITESDYRHFLESPSNSLLWSRIISEFTSKHIVFIGYSADDQNILNLIELVKRQTSGSLKKMYLIVPYLTAIQNKRLNNLGISTASGTGEEFLEKVLSSLKESFGDDKYNNICSQDTLNRFALLNGLLVSFENDGKHTRITRLRDINGNPCPLKIEFSAKSPEFVFNRNTVSLNDIVKGFSIPAYSLTEDEVATYRVTANDLQIYGKDEISNVYIGPAVSDIDVIFIAAELDISCRCKANRYADKGICHIHVPTPLFNFEISMDFSDTSKNAILGTLSAKLNTDYFDDLDDAIKWSRLLKRMRENEKISLRIGKLKIDNLKFTNDNKDLLFYKQLWEYCTNLKDIERATDTLFPYYDSFTPQNYIVSKIVRSYIKHEAYIDSTRPDNKEFTIDVEKGDFKVDGDYVVRLISKITNPISLCGVDYSIDEERILILHCKVTSVEHLNSVRDRIHFVNVENSIQYEYCNAGDKDMIIDASK